MGCSMSVEEKEGRQRNEEIENQLRKDRMSQMKEIKMLLLGKFYFSNTMTTITFIFYMTLTSMFLAQAPESLANQQSSNK